MIGIIEVLYSKNEIITEKIYIENIEFFKITIYIKELKSFFSKKTLNKAFKILVKNNIKTVCIKDGFDEYLEKYGIIREKHDFVYKAKLYDIIDKYKNDFECVYVYANKINQEIQNFIEYLPKRFNNIRIEGDTKQIENILFSKYGVSNLQVSYDKKTIAVYWSKPKEIFNDFFVINMSCENIDTKCISDIECYTDEITLDTDITAICNYILKHNKKYIEKIKIKNIVTKA